MAGVELWVDPAFVEEAVFLELRARAARGDFLMAQAFHAERTARYDPAGSAGDREAGFQELAARYFQQLGFTDLVAERFAEFPLVDAQLRMAMAHRVWSRAEERVELYVGASGTRAAGASSTLSVGLQAERCLNRGWLAAFLRHELLHVSDMLDPAFAYTPHPDLGGACEVEDDVIRDRFRLLWDLFVDGRIRRRGWQTVVDGARRRQEFEQAFAGWDPARRQTVFQDLSSRAQCTQRELLDLANDERLARMLGSGGLRCPLCHFPSRDGVGDWRGERSAVAEAIRADYPQWEPAQGACRQCVELYRSRAPATR